MPAKSKSQQRLMGMVYALKSGKLKTSDLPSGVAEKVKKVAKGMSKKSAKDFALTKTKNLPSKVKEDVDFSNITLLEILELFNVLSELNNKEQETLDKLLEIRDLKPLQQKHEEEKKLNRQKMAVGIPARGPNGFEAAKKNLPVPQKGRLVIRKTIQEK